jgi:hypothetical protein
MTHPKINKEEFLAIKSEITDDGITISSRGRKYKIVYPKEIWQEYSDTNKEVLLDNLTFMKTSYLAAANNKKGIVYSTAMPLFETFAFKSTMYDIPSTASIDKQKTSEYLKRFFNSTFVFASYDTVMPDLSKKRKASTKKKPAAIIPFTAGKESLLTLGLCLEMGIRPIPVYIDEDPEHPETKHKEKVIRIIEAEYGIKVYRLLSEAGKKLRFVDDVENNWGLGNQLLSYVLELAPFATYFDADYIFFGNEYSCDEFGYDKEGFKSTFWFDQRSEWTKQLSTVAKIMTNNNTEVCSLVNPLYEIGIIKILHERYPYLAQFQISCFSDTEEGKHNIWCGNCPKCAWLYALFKGVGINTEKVGFKHDMFSKQYAKQFSIFGGGEIYSEEVLGSGIEEQELAFFMAAERGEKGDLIEEFKKMPAYETIKSNFKKIHKKYFSQYESVTVPYELKEKLMDIFDETFEGEFSIKDFRIKQPTAEKVEAGEEMIKSKEQ